MSSMFRSPDDITSDDGSSSHVSNEQPLSGAPSSQNIGRHRQEAARQGIVARVPKQDCGSLLPHVAPHQHTSLIYLALLEGRCKTKALEVLNAGRPPSDRLTEDDSEVVNLATSIYAELAPELGKTLGLPQEIVQAEGASIRSTYLSGLDDFLVGTAAKALSRKESVPLDDEGQRAYILPAASDDNGKARDTTAQFVLALKSPSHVQGLIGQTGALCEPHSPFINKSIYSSENQEICLLGKGGYGEVWKVHNLLDGCDYAIKKIVISSHRIKKIRDQAQVDALLAELRTLARLNHTNIVRYYHGWIETTVPTVTPRDENQQGLLVHGAEETTTFSETMDSNEILRLDDLNLGIIDDSDVMGQFEHDLLVQEGELDDVIFADDSMSTNDYLPRDRKRRESQATTSSTATFKASLKSLGEDQNDDDEVEIIPRKANELKTSCRDGDTVPPSQKWSTQYLEADMTLFIKMSLHPLTLSAYITSELPVDKEDHCIRHCFHTKPSLQILSAILDGVEYLHSQRFIHRDLKPANIFLSVHHGTAPSPNGYVNIRSCPQCLSSLPTDESSCTSHPQSSPIYITPCIGDFGLIAQMANTGPEDKADDDGSEGHKSSPLAQLHAKPVGTHFYRPSSMPAAEPRICPRLDVYSLGVILTELLYRFDTRTERAMVLTDLGKGKLPSDFARQSLHAGILAMCEEDRDRRWECQDIRKWLSRMMDDETLVN